MAYPTGGNIRRGTRKDGLRRCWKQEKVASDARGDAAFCLKSELHGACKPTQGAAVLLETPEQVICLDIPVIVESLLG